VCASSDYEQLALLCDRVFVVADGEVVDELRGELTEERIAERCYRSTSLEEVLVSDGPAEVTT